MNSKYKKYIIIEDDSLLIFEEKVNKYLTDGWEPQGGIFYTNYYYFQAMVKPPERQNLKKKQIEQSLKEKQAEYIQ